ncbi:arylamine N-acetyltransferase [Streptomyces sp. NPDC006798]|uniref:arylamine N-acetyltransferase family protein n=1 Tax=Streptomyces sp. NPDC006798 TaxID=3155462 RepID=UPI0033F277D9
MIDVDGYLRVLGVDRPRRADAEGLWALHRAGVRDAPEDPAGVQGNHLALTVRLDGEPWLVDTGLGTAVYEPLPLRAGTCVQGPFGYGMVPSSAAPGGWRFVHDPRGAFTAMDFAPDPVEPASFGAEHLRLSTSPDSPFVRVVTAQVRRADGVDVLRGRVPSRIRAGGTDERTIHAADDWFDVLTGVFGLDLGDADAPARAGLWRRVRAAHEKWAAGQPG